MKTTSTPKPTCSADTAYAAVNGQSTISPSGVPWALIYKLTQPGVYTSNLVAGASSYANGGNGGCLAPGTGGGCGSIVGSVSISLTDSKVNAVFTASPGTALLDAAIRFSCAPITDRGQPGKYQIKSANHACGTDEISLSGKVPKCPNGIYIMFKGGVVSGGEGCSISGCMV